MYVKVNVRASANKEKFTRISKDHFDIDVKEKAERNMANRRVVELVKTALKVRKVRIVSGHHSPGKILDIE